MRYDDASQAEQNGHSDTVARPDVDTLAPGNYGPATGNAITGAGTTTGSSGADIVGSGPATIVAVQGAGGAAVQANGAFQATGQYGALSIDAQGNFSYVRNPGTPDGVQDVFNYTLADASGDNASTTLTIDIGQVAAALASQGVLNLPAGVEMSDIHVNGRDLVIDMPDGSQMVIPGGAVFVPQIMIGDVQVPPTNLAALLIDSEPQPAAGTPQSSGGNFAAPVPPLDPGVPLGDLIPPTELTYTPPEFQEVNQFIDREPTVIIVTPDFPAGAVNASESVNEKGLPVRNGAEPAGSGEISDGNGSNDSDGSETNTGTIVFTAEDGLESITINGEAVTAVGQEIEGEFGTLTITGIDLNNGQITYSYTLGDNTSGDSTADVFDIVVTDDDGDVATGSLTVNIIDDVPTARNDTDVTDLVNHVATGNVMTGADTTSGAAGADTVGADNATLTAVSSNNSGESDSSFDSNGNLVVEGEFGTLTIKADGSYSYAAGPNTPGGSTEVFTYTLTDGDGDTSQATLTIVNPDQTPSVGVNGLVQLDDDALPGGNPGGVGDDPDSVNTSGTLSGSGGDGPLSFALTENGAPEGFTYQLQSNGSLWVLQGSTHVLTITVNAATGAYTVTQVAPIDHPAGDNENNVGFDVSYTVTDSDGDSVTGHLPISVDDDTPIARNDTDSVANGAESTDGNVLTGAGTTSGASGADSAGADGLPNGVTGVHAGTTGSFAAVDSDGTLVHGTFGDLVLHSDGTYTYTIVGNQGAGGSDVFTYEIIDGDGDVSTATLTINVPADSIPVANNASALVDDDGLPAGNHDSAPGDDTQDPDPDNDESTFSGSVSANFGTDGPGTFTFSSDMDGKVVTIGQEQVTYHVVGNVLTAEVSAGDRTGLDLFTVTLNSNGTYTVQLENNILQVDDGTNTENNATADITFTAHDNNGDSDNGTLTITFDDDIPVAIIPPPDPQDPEAPPPPLIHGLVDEDDLSISNGDNVDGNHDHVTGDDEPIDASGDSDPTTTGGGAHSLDALFNGGADQPLTYSLGDTDGLPVLHSGGVLVTYEVVGNQLIASAGSETVFTLTVNPDGSWSFDLVGALDHPAGNFENNIDLDLGSIIVATDADGDSAPAADGAFIVTVDDDLPTAIIPPPDPEHPNDPPPPLVTGLVDEDDLNPAAPQNDNSLGNHDDALGDDDPGNLDGDNDGTTTGGNAGSLTALFNAGADIPLTIVLSADTDALEAQGLTSNGHDLLYRVNAEGTQLTAYADLNGDGNINASEAVASNTIFTLTVNPETGAWVFNLQDQLDHSEPGVEDNILIDFSSVVTAIDADGDPATAAPGSFVINVDDDMPQPFDEENCPVVTIVNDAGSHAEGQFDMPPVGADDPGKFSFGVTDNTAVLDSGGQPVTAEGQALFYFVNDAGTVLEAREGGESGALVFTITLNQDGSFEYNQLIDIDNGGGGVSFNDLTSTSAGNVEFRGVGADDADTTVDLLLSADDNGTDATVNTDSDSIGSANQSMDVGETVRIDFVTNLTSGAATPSQFGYDAHVSSNTFTGFIPQVQGNQEETVAFTVWALNSTNDSTTEPDRDPSDGFSDSTPTAITDVTVQDYETGAITTVDVTGFTVGTFTDVAYGISVRVNADGSVTFSGIQQGDHYGFTTDGGEFNAVAVQSEPKATGGSTEDSFDLGVFSIGVANAGEPVDFHVPVVFTDADGDPVDCDIDFTLNPGTVAATATVTVNEAALDLVVDNRTGTANDDLVAGTVVGSNPGSGAETVSGDLSAGVSGTAPFTFALADGESATGTFGTIVIHADGTFTYTLASPVDSATDDDGTNPEVGAETFSYEVTDGNGVTTTGTISVNIIDDVPTAHADTNSVAEGGTLTVLAADGVLDNDVAGADGLAAGGGVTGVAAGNDTSAPVTGGVAAPLVGAWGTLTLNANGSYTYHADPNTNPPADAQDVFVYTITDGDGDTSTTTLTIDVNDVTIPGDNDVVQVDEAALDLVQDNRTGTLNDDLAAGTVVGSNPGSANETVSGQLVIAGVGATGYVVQDQTTAHGVFHLNADGSYTYTLTTPFDGSGGDDGPVADGQEVFNYVAHDGDGNEVTGTITVNVLDDVPTANPDTNSVNEGGTLTVLAADGVLDNDVAGADGLAAGGGVTGVAAGNDTSNPVTGGVAAPLAGDWGTLTLNANGSYTYHANPNTDPPADAQDVFVYTITDGDGDTSTTTLTIDVNDVTLSGNDQTKTVFEKALDLVADNRTGTLNDDLAAGNVVGSDPTSATETVSGQLAVAGAVSYAIVSSETGNYGLIHINTDGSYTYTLTDPVDNSPHADDGPDTEFGAEVFTYEATDGDGNTVTGTITIDVVDDTPTAAVSTAGFSISHDETPGLDGDADDVAGPLSVFAGVDNPGDDPDVAPDGAGSVIGYATSTGAISSTGTIFGADGAAATDSVVFSLDISDAAGVDSGLNTTNGTNIFLFVEDGLVVGRVGATVGAAATGAAAFAIAIDSASGEVSMVQYLSIQHGDDTNPDESASITNGAILAVVTATDGDGDVDTASTGIGNLISFQDDAPTMGTIPDGTANNDPASDHTTGSFAFDPGADGVGTITIAPDLDGLKSDGLPLIGEMTDGHTFTAYIDDDGTAGISGGDTVVFTISVDPDAGTYDFDLQNPLDGATEDVILGQSTSFGVGPSDSIIVSQPDLPNLVFVKGYHVTSDFDFDNWSGGGTVTDAELEVGGVNGSTAGWSTDSNNFDATTFMRFDFGVLNDYDGGGPYSPPSDVMHDAVKATFDLFGYSGEHIFMVVHYTDNTTQLYDFLGTGQHTPAVVGDGTKTIAWVDVYNQDAGSGKVDLESITIVNETVDIDIPVTLTIEDGDGDPSSGSFTINVADDNEPSSALAATADTSMQTMSFETTSLMASNDNHGQHTQETQRVAVSGQNVVLMGALAAAGLESAHGNLGSHSIAGSIGNHGATVEAALFSSVSAHSVEATHSLAPAHAADAMAVAQAVQATLGTTRFHDMGDHARGVAHTDAKQGGQMTELLHGSNGPAHGQAADATPVTAAAVAMPSAEQLMAAAGGDAAQAQASVAGEGAQHNQVIGKVLADALHGGNHGPNIDGLLHAMHGNGPAHDAVEAFASHGGSGVPYGHMGFATAFAGPHGMLAVEMMHSDAAPPAHG